MHVRLPAVARDARVARGKPHDFLDGKGHVRLSRPQKELESTVNNEIVGVLAASSKCQYDGAIRDRQRRGTWVVASLQSVVEWLQKGGPWTR